MQEYIDTFRVTIFSEFAQLLNSLNVIVFCEWNLESFIIPSRQTKGNSQQIPNTKTKIINTRARENTGAIGEIFKSLITVASRKSQRWKIQYRLLKRTVSLNNHSIKTK